ncbi:IclR family acetate operon transcriptional repressor [Deinococcus budaensis]|uniref:IclR family acetate operon transcriptional repressor n=1 Tax=Deinococcus budaensis TaxID=1665626 RepID=A0A7W8LQH7_9DEIO|nr:IclR family transcriptional regulator [Deinococcus budaensis]MBB5234754.1 IclR family acetate operon transcriptional repressor [Deinococcus budaensis]
MTTTTKQKPGRTRSGETGSVRTLERGLSVLLALKDLRRAPLSVLARHVGLSASTTYRLLETLRQQGFVEWEEQSGVYSVGLRAYQVGLAFTERSNLIQSAHPEMEALVRDLNETVNLAVLYGAEAVYVHQVEGRQLMRMFARLGDSSPLHASGVGKVLLAWRPEADVRQKLGDGPYPAYTPRSISTYAALLGELEQVREQGYSVDDEERELGVRCVAVPVRDHTRQVVASLSVSAPTSRFTKDQIAGVAGRMNQAAVQVSTRLGWG